MEDKENAASAVAPTDVEATAADGRGEGHQTSDGEGDRTAKRPQNEEDGQSAPGANNVGSPTSDELILQLVDEVGRLAGVVSGLHSEVSELQEELRHRDEKVKAKPAVEPLWTREDVKAFLQCSPRFVDSLIADGQLKGVLIGSLRRFDPRTVEAFVRDSGNPRLRRVKGNNKKAA